MARLLSYRPRRLFSDRPNPTYTPKPWHKIIHWGNNHGTSFNGVARVVNNPLALAVAGNKLETFQALKDKDGIRIPEFTTSRDTAIGWLREDKSAVVCRTNLTGHSGAGIVLANTEAEIVGAPLYVRYIKKQKEFRVHVVFGEVIDVQEKRKRADLPDGFTTNFQVRNHHTGWVYCRENIIEPEGMRRMATMVVQTLALDFGAVDIIYNEKRNECYVLEVNTAPGLEGSTVDKYAEAFVRHLK